MSEIQAPPKNRTLRIFRKGFAALIIVIIFFFLARNLYQNWQKIINFQWNIDIGLLIGSLVLLIAGLIFLGYIWQQILKRLQVTLPFSTAGKIWFLSGVARYLPGALWQIAGLVYLGQKEGITILKSTLSAVLAQILSIAAGFVVGSQILFFIPLPHQQVTWYVVSIVMTLLSLGILYPPLLRRVINFFLKKTGRPLLEFSFRFTDLIIFLVLYIVGWIMIGIAFAVFVKSVTPTGWSTLIPLIAIFSASYIVGFLSIITPSGLGVREGAMALFLSSSFALPVATVIAIGARIWITVGELICLVIFVPFAKRSAPTQNNLYSDDYYQRAVAALERQNRFFKTRIENIRRLVVPDRREHILDLGTGMGTVTLEFSKIGVRMTGIDLSQKAVGTAQRLARRQHLTEVAFVRATATQLPFRENTFEKVIAADLVEHLTDQETVLALQESCRVLQPRGRVYVYTPCPTHLFELLKKRNIFITNDPSHVQLKSVAFLHQALESVALRTKQTSFAPSHLPGFQILERTLWNLPLIGKLFRRRICLSAEKPEPRV